MTDDTQFNILDHIDSTDTTRHSFVDIPELNLPHPFELIEPMQGQVIKLQETYVRYKGSGIDLEKSGMEEMNCAKLALMLYYEGKPVFPKGMEQARRVLSTKSESVCNRLLEAMRKLTDSTELNPAKVVAELEKN